MKLSSWFSINRERYKNTHRLNHFWERETVFAKGNISVHILSTLRDRGVIYEMYEI